MAKEKLASRFGRSVYIWKDLNQYSWFNSLHDKAVYIYIYVFFNHTYFTFIQDYMAIDSSLLSGSWKERPHSLEVYLQGVLWVMKCDMFKTLRGCIFHWNTLCIHVFLVFLSAYVRDMLYVFIFIDIYILINIYIYMYRTCIMLFSLFVPNLCGWPNTLDVYYIYIYTYGICYIYISNLDTCSLFMSFQDMRFVKGAFSGALFELNYKQLQGIDNFLSISLFFGKFSYTIHVWHV